MRPTNASGLDPHRRECRVGRFGDSLASWEIHFFTDENRLGSNPQFSGGSLCELGVRALTMELPRALRRRTSVGFRALYRIFERGRRSAYLVLRYIIGFHLCHQFRSGRVAFVSRLMQMIQRVPKRRRVVSEADPSARCNLYSRDVRSHDQSIARRQGGPSRPPARVRLFIDVGWHI